MPSSAKVVLLAGGEGTRLRPFTTLLPKALVPVGGVPILDIIVGQLRQQGFRKLVVSAGYLADRLDAHVSRISSDGLDVEIEIVRESTPLGTAGCLSIVPDLADTFLVMNADILTTLDFRQLVRGHRASGAALTVAASERVTRLDWGVLEATADDRLIGYDEKPTRSMWVSMGVYVCEPVVPKSIPHYQRLDMPDLIGRLLASGEVVRIHRSRDYWLDVGHPHDYARACEDFEARRSEFQPATG